VKNHRKDKKATALWDSFFFDSAFDEASRHSYMQRNVPEVSSMPFFALDRIPADDLPASVPGINPNEVSNRTTV
jgi:hypothetical protein